MKNEDIFVETTVSDPGKITCSVNNKQCSKILYKKDVHDSDHHDGVITHVEPHILECKVKWALGSITVNKASGEIWKTGQWPQDWKRSVFISIPKKGKAKECSNY